MGLFFYNIFLSVYSLGVRIVSVRNKKAAAWVAGRKNIFNDLKSWRNETGAGERLVWMHCASLGEFEQGRPVIEKIRVNYPDYKILVTFFSPSGYEIRKNYSGADGVFYLPPDGETNALKFTEIIKPSLVIWVKYEYWYYYLSILKRKNIPVILVSAIFRDSQPFFKWYGKIWKEMLGCFTRVFVQNAESLAMLQTISQAENACIAGDTRFDRVIDNAERPLALPEKLMRFYCDHKVIVAGSTWEADEEKIVHYVKTHSHIRFIIAPHVIDKIRLKEQKKLFGNTLLYSEFIAGIGMPQVIIVDNIGMLSKLYSLADIAYVGGGFNESGIHNILEAAVFGKPIIFGPQFEKFQEATELTKAGGAFSINTALELEAVLHKLLNDPVLLKTTGAICKKYVYENRGATEIILQYLQANRLLTN